MLIPVLGGPEEGLVSWIDERDIAQMALLSGPKKPADPSDELSKQIDASLKGRRPKRASAVASAAVGWLLALR